MTQETATRFRVSVNDKFLGEKIIQGDNRHAEYHGAFQPAPHTPKSLFAAIQEGQAFCAELLKGDCGREHHGQWCCQERREKGDPTHCGRPDGYRHSHHFKSSQVLALDDDARNLSLDELLSDPFVAKHATFIYPTISWSPESRKWRIVFILTEPITDAEVYRRAATALLGRYETTDQRVKDPARLFFGMKPGNGEAVYRGNLLPMSEVLKLVSEYENRRRQIEQETNRRQLPSVDSSKITGNTRDERYISRAMEEERAWLASRPAGTGERYPEIIPSAMRLESLRQSEWLSPEARSQVHVADIVLAACAMNGSLEIYGESHLRKAIDWGIAHAEVRPVPNDWATEHQNGHGVNGVGAVDASSPSEVEEWQKLGELPQAPIPPSLPPEMVPEPLRPWLLDIARQGCFPLEMVAAPALVSIASIIGRRLAIRPWPFSDYTVVPNLWGSIVARPASMKSYAIDQASKPLKRLAATARDRFQAKVAADTAHVFALEAEVEGLKSQMKQLAKKGESAGALEDHMALKIQELESSRPVERRYWVSDSTPEKLADLLRENPNGLLVSYDELAGWLGEMEKQGREGSRAFYLAAWEGTGDHYVDRVQRGSNYIPAVCLSVIGGIQPDRLRRHIDEALLGGTGGDGMLQRFQMMVSIDCLGEWKAPDSWPDGSAKEMAYQVFQALDEMEMKALGEQSDDGIPYVRFSSEAQALADQWRNELELRLRGDTFKDTPAFEAHIGKYRSLMPSLALIFHLIDISVAPKEGKTEVPLGAVELSADWCGYLEDHARAIYQAEVSPGLNAAHRLAEKIKEGRITHGEGVRDIYRHQWSGLTTSAQVSSGLEVLESAGWVRVISQPTAGAPVTVVQLHPGQRGRKDA